MASLAMTKTLKKWIPRKGPCISSLRGRQLNSLTSIVQKGRSNLNNNSMILFKTDLTSPYRVFNPAVSIFINYLHPDNRILLPFYRQ